MVEPRSEVREISSLKLWDKNPRGINKADFERLKRSIVKRKQYKPLLVTEDGIVLGGNMRLRAFQELGVEKVWVSVVHAPDDKTKLEYALSDNDRAGYYEDEKLAELILENDSIDLEEFKVDLADPLSLAEIKDRFAPDKVIEDEAPDVEDVEPASKLGEVYQLGRHRLMCGDSTKVEDVEELMDGHKATMVFTDPPYNVNYGASMKDALRHKAGSSPGRTILNDNFESNEQFYQFLYDSISAMRNFVVGDVYICMSSSELHTLQKAFINCDGHWSTFIIWVKNTFTLGRSNYQRQYEPILYGWFEGSSHYWSGVRSLSDVIKQEAAKVDEVTGDVYLRVDNLSTDIWEFPKPNKSVEHPTMKPVSLVARAIINSSQPGNVVLDLFGGGGSTLIASEQTNRTCYMMELDPKYCDVIRKRYYKFIGREDEWNKIT